MNNTNENTQTNSEDESKEVIIDINSTDYLRTGYIYDYDSKKKSDSQTGDIDEPSNNPVYIVFRELFHQLNVKTILETKKSINSTADTSDPENYSLIFFYAKSENSNKGYARFLYRKKTEDGYEYRVPCAPLTIDNPYYVEKKRNESEQTIEAKNFVPLDERKTLTISDADGWVNLNVILESSNHNILLYPINVPDKNKENTTSTNQEGIQTKLENCLIFDDEPIDTEYSAPYGITSKKKIFSGMSQTPKKVYILKTDAYVNINSFEPKTTIILDGGNLYRHHKLSGIPYKIICKNGTFIDVPSVDQLKQGAVLSMQHSIIKEPNTDCSLSLMNSQSNIALDLNPLDYIQPEDYTIMESVYSINLNNLFDRIINAVYIRQSQSQRLVIKMPENSYGFSFYLKRPLVIPYGVTLDMSDATIFIPGDFKPIIREKNVKGLDILDDNGIPVDKYQTVDYIISFGTNDVYSILANSSIKNTSISFSQGYFADIDSTNLPRKVIDLTNFSGIMENIDINLGNKNYMIAFWQPMGTSSTTYSDQKIIRRCRVRFPGWRTETPTAIFCYGDGRIIEQCNLGYVAIFCGKSYTIKGCLNDKYFLFDSTVNFSGSYWEIGQFQILDSKVKFSECMLNAQNNHFETNHPENSRRYIGPWMAIDTEGCRQHAVHILESCGLGLDRFNEVENVPTSVKGKFLARASSVFSTVVFEPTVRSSSQFWAYRQSMCCPLFMAGPSANIIGLENLACMNDIYIHNYITESNCNNDSIGVTINRPAVIPLINNDFYKLKTDITVPGGVSLKCSYTPKDPNSTINTTNWGLNWKGNKISKARARFVLDEKRKVYSQTYTCPDEFTLNDGDSISFALWADIAGEDYRNLMAELIFIMTDNDKRERTYRFREHVYRVVDGDILSFGKGKIVPVKNEAMYIVDFNIGKFNFNYEALERQSDVEPIVCDADLPVKKSAETSAHGLTLNPGKDPIEIEDSILPESGITLFDRWGNNYSPESVSTRGNVATKLQHIGEDNVRVYLGKLPSTGTWSEGDEVILPTAAYRYFNGAWQKYITFA